MAPAQAAYYMNWGEYLSWRDRRIRSYDQYLLKDSPLGAFATGLLFPNGSPKPGYFAYRMPLYLPSTSTTPGHALEVWGCVRPSRYVRLQTHAVQQAELQFQAGSSGAFKTVRVLGLTDPQGYFDILQKFPGSGNVRVAWSYPHGPQIFSRTVSVSIR